MRSVATRRRYAQRWVLYLCMLALLGAIAPLPALARQSEHPLDTAGAFYAFLPILALGSPIDACAPIAGESYGALSVAGAPTDRPAERHADLNLALRSYSPTGAYRGLVDYDGGTDPGAPQLVGLFAAPRAPDITAVHRVYDWNWATNSRSHPIINPLVTLMELATHAGETIHVPNSGYTLGSGYEVLVLYASAQRITLKYTRSDSVVQGYTLHIEGICVEPSLLALYEAWNAAGRGHLPALAAGQPLGRARGDAIGVVIRDCGSFMDPRSRKDWWRGY
jgi:hypothetical protein